MLLVWWEIPHKPRIKFTGESNIKFFLENWSTYIKVMNEYKVARFYGHGVQHKNIF